MRATALSIILLYAGTTLALADPVEEAPVTTMAGQQVRLGAYAVPKADCSGGVAAELHPRGDQRGGILIVSLGTLTTTHARGCASVTTPAQVMVYRPNPGFSGTDRVTFGVVDPTTGRESIHNVAVTVAP